MLTREVAASQACISRAMASPWDVAFRAGSIISRPSFLRYIRIRIKLSVQDRYMSWIVSYRSTAEMADLQASISAMVIRACREHKHFKSVSKRVFNSKDYKSAKAEVLIMKVDGQRFSDRDHGRAHDDVRWILV